MRDSSSGKKVFFGAGSDLAFAVLKVQFWVDNTEIRDYFTGIWFHEHTERIQCTVLARNGLFEL